MSALEKIGRFLQQAPQKISRWPGVAVRLSTGTKADKIDFRRGTVLKVTDLTISVEMDHPLYKLVKCMGESYAHWCPNCSATIPGNVTYRRPAEAVENSSGDIIPMRFHCPYCGPDHMLRMFQPGDKVRLHYRFEADGSSAAWFMERWDW